MTGPDRPALLEVLRTMPDEAFQWLAVMLEGRSGRGQIFPDGIGGFMPESQASIRAARAAAAAYLTPARSTTTPRRA